MTTFLKGKYGNYILALWICSALGGLYHYNLLTVEFLLSPLYNLYNLFQGCMVFAGLYLDMRLFKMLYFEMRYYRNAGEDYLRYGSKYVKLNLHKK